MTSSAAMGRPSPRRRLQLLVIAIALLVVGLLATTELLEQNREMSQLLDAVQHSERAMERENTRLALIARDAGPSASWTADDVARYKAEAARASARVRAERSRVSDVKLAPWHLELRRARSRYRAHQDAWTKLYDAYATLTGAAYMRESRRANIVIAATWDTAARTFRDALPWLAFSGNRTRVETIFKG